MVKRNHTHQEPPPDELDELKYRLEETEETLRAIQQYMVDAFVVNRENGIQVVTLNESEIPYRMMVESMNEGAVTLIPDGTIFYCNPRFGEMIGRDCETLVGTPFRALIVSEGQAAFETIFRRAGQKPVRGESFLKKADGESMPVQLSIYQLGADKLSGLAIIATDISERVQSEAKIRNLASKLSMVEQEERHRISGVLHDDLQQRLFAIKAQLSFFNDFLEKDQLSAGAYSELDQIQESLSEAIAITRNLSIDLNPVVLHGNSLGEAMSWLSFRMKEQHGLHIDLDVKESFSQLEQHVRMMLFQSMRELLFNVVKHAGVLEARVTLEQIDGRGRITISDDGNGFDAETVLKDRNMAHGLLVVQDRLNLSGCGMDIVSQPGDGTHIQIEFPVEANNPGGNSYLSRQLIGSE
ncbi:MAG TPA: PAS domain S-box protein [Anaerolineales bacterium]|nr:PAS domain S-box protein [Anaerolineales bacterium]